MADQKISQLSAAAALTGTELVPIVQSSATVATTASAIKTYATTELVSTYGFGNTSRDVPDLTAVAGNYSQIGRLLSGATGGTGVLSGFVALPLDGTPTTTYVATANGRLWTGYKSSAGGTPTWTEYAKLTSPAFSTSLTVNGPFSGGTSFVAARSTGEIQSGVTSSFTAFDSVNSTAAASFTLPALAHFRVTGVTVNAPSAVTNQYGFRVLSNLTGATNNYSFYSDLAAATGCWNLYFPGSASNYINGALGIGTTNVGGANPYSLRVSKTLTGGTSWLGVGSDGAVASDVTATAVYYRTTAQTQAASFTLTNLVHYQAVQGSIGAGSAITTQSGFVADSSLVGASFNIGFRGQIAAAAQRWNMYLDGTAQNYIQGNVGIGTGKLTPAFALDVNGTINGTYHSGATANTLTAAGTNLATALALAAEFNVVTSAAAGTGVSLPNVVGARIWVFNNQATNAINVYPPSGTLNGSTSVSLAANGKMQYVQIAAGVWYTMS